jgi:hypothetical protein
MKGERQRDTLQMIYDVTSWTWFVEHTSSFSLPFLFVPSLSFWLSDEQTGNAMPIGAVTNNSNYCTVHIKAIQSQAAVSAVVSGMVTHSRSYTAEISILIPLKRSLIQKNVRRTSPRLAGFA